MTCRAARRMDMFEATAEIGRELAYRSYAHQRRLRHEIPAAEWAALFTEAAAFEIRYQAEHQPQEA